MRRLESHLVGDKHYNTCGAKLSAWHIMHFYSKVVLS